MVGVNESQTVTPTGGKEEDLSGGVYSIVLYSLIQSSRQDPNLKLVNSCCTFGCNNAVDK